MIIKDNKWPICNIAKYSVIWPSLESAVVYGNCMSIQMIQQRCEHTALWISMADLNRAHLAKATTCNSSSIFNTAFCMFLWSDCYTIFTVLPETQKLYFFAMSHWSVLKTPREKKNKETSFWDDPRSFFGWDSDFLRGVGEVNYSGESALGFSWGRGRMSYAPRLCPQSWNMCFYDLKRFYENFMTNFGRIIKKFWWWYRVKIWKILKKNFTSRQFFFKIANVKWFFRIQFCTSESVLS